MRPTAATRLHAASADDAPARWSMTAYPARSAVCGGIATPATPRPSIICQGSLPIAEQLQSRPLRVLPSVVVLERDRDRVDVLVYGFADGDTGRLPIVTTGGHTVGELRRTDEHLDLPIDRNSPDLTP